METRGRNRTLSDAHVSDSRKASMSDTRMDQTLQFAVSAISAVYTTELLKKKRCRWVGDEHPWVARLTYIRLKGASV
jgi:hypothetical protein